MTAIHPSATVPAAAALSPGRAALTLVGIIAALAGYVGAGLLLHIAAIFAGSLFLFFWAGQEKSAPERFLPALVGALGGIGNACLLNALPIAPIAGWILALGLVVVVLYLLLLEKLPILCNQSYMLFVTVAFIPQLANKTMYVSMVEGVLLSAAYFGVLFWALRRFGAAQSVNTLEAVISDDHLQGGVESGPEPLC